MRVYIYIYSYTNDCDNNNNLYNDDKDGSQKLLFFNKYGSLSPKA